MIKVDYQKSEVLNSWLQTPNSRRKELTTISNKDLVKCINYVNIALMLTCESQATFEVLECLVTNWSEETYIDLKTNYLKSDRLFKLLEKNYSEFLKGTKELMFYQEDWVKIVKERVDTWEEFQTRICQVIEQAFLKAHFEKLEASSQKTAQKLMQPKNKKKKKKPKQTEEDCLVLDLSETSTQGGTDNEDLEYFFLNENTLGARSSRIRKHYASVGLEWDSETQEVLSYLYNEAMNPYVPLYDYYSYPVVRYYFPAPTRFNFYPFFNN